MKREKRDLLFERQKFPPVMQAKFLWDEKVEFAICGSGKVVRVDAIPPSFSAYDLILKYFFQPNPLWLSQLTYSH